MGQRCETLTPATVIDLDGTLVRGNTLKMYTRFVASLLLRRGRLVDLTAILAYVALRRMHLISHVSMKHAILRHSINHITSDDIHRFVDRVMTHLHSEVVNILKQSRADHHLCILATAAPDIYAREIGERCAFDYVVATPMSTHPRDYIETRGEEKLRHVLAILEQRHAYLHTVVTDHDDDRPLLNAYPVRSILIH